WAMEFVTESALASAGFADVKRPAIFSDNMVLQKAEKTAFFGSADKGEKVSVKVGNASADAVAGDDGKWKLFVDTRSAQGAVGVTISGNNSITIKNALIGEVWVASGQSNMEMSVAGSKDADLETTSANYPEIRMFTVKKAIALEPAKDVVGMWEVCTPQTVPHFSAVGYFFARDLNQNLKVPVGVIHTSWGGTVAEAWTSREALAAADPDVKVIIDRFDEARKRVTPEVKAQYEAELKAWQQAGSPRGKQPKRPSGVDDPNAPTALYNAMVAPIVGYNMKGAIW